MKSVTSLQVKAATVCRHAQIIPASAISHRVHTQGRPTSASTKTVEVITG